MKLGNPSFSVVHRNKLEAKLSMNKWLLTQQRRSAFDSSIMMFNNRNKKAITKKLMNIVRIVNNNRGEKFKIAKQIELLFVLSLLQLKSAISAEYLRFKSVL